MALPSLSTSISLIGALGLASLIAFLTASFSGVVNEDGLSTLVLVGLFNVVSSA
ncbi:MAG: hypothetical protein SPI53_06235 [Erysipelotrichaceae bacterium]|nr:hypothetical protein [Erysipelotrichaceae bacterium]